MITVLVVETPVFSRIVQELLSADEYRRLQVEVVTRPERGRLIRGGAGLRKLCWGTPGRGKRGGLRLIYYWDRSATRIYMIYAYDKRQQSDLTRSQLARLARLAREELK